MSSLNQLNVKSVFFLIFAAFIAILFLNIVSPFISILVISLIIVQIFHPIYRKLLDISNNKGISAFITTFISIAFLIIPIVIIFLLSASEISNVVEQFNINNETTTVSQVLGESDSNDILDIIELNTNQIISNIENSLNNIGINLGSIINTDGGIEVNIRDSVRDILFALQAEIIPIASNILSGSLTLIFQLFILVVTLIYLFIEFDNLPKIVSKYSPLEDEIDALLWNKFIATTKAVIIGSFLVAFAQATAVLIPMIILGIGAPVLIWILMVLFSLIPVGSGVIWGPIGIALIISGSPVAGIFLLLYGAISINIIETTLRPRLLRNSTQLHPLILIFSALGGIGVFGILGILYGPVIAVFLISTLEIYNMRFKN